MKLRAGVEAEFDVNVPEVVLEALGLPGLGIASKSPESPESPDSPSAEDVKSAIAGCKPRPRQKTSDNEELRDWHVGVGSPTLDSDTLVAIAETVLGKEYNWQPEVARTKPVQYKPVVRRIKGGEAVAESDRTVGLISS